MYHRSTEDERHSFDSGEILSTQFVFEARNMTGLILEDAGKRLDRNLLFKQQENLGEALERLWSGVEEGKVKVDCLPLLRTTRNISCPEISHKLRAPEIDHVKVIRELRLMVNTFQYVIRPKKSRYL